MTSEQSYMLVVRFPSGSPPIGDISFKILFQSTFCEKSLNCLIHTTKKQNIPIVIVNLLFSKLLLKKINEFGIVQQF